MKNKLLALFIIMIIVLLTGCNQNSVATTETTTSNNITTTHTATLTTTSAGTTKTIEPTTTSSTTMKTAEPTTTTENTENITTSNEDYSLLPGYVSLLNQNENGPVLDGKYQVAEQTFNVVDTYKTTYAFDPTDLGFDYLANTQWTDALFYSQMIDGLVEHDRYGNLVGDLAIGYKVIENDDGTETWYLQLRPDILWVENANGTTYAPVTADDFVTGLKYVLDPDNRIDSDKLYIANHFIFGAANYYDSLKDDNVPDLSFTSVGVKAESDNVIAYTLIQQTPYFLSMLTDSPFLPVNATYLASQNGDFGTSENNILVNGAFRMTDHTDESSITFVKNDKYWDKGHVYVNTVECRYVPYTQFGQQDHVTLRNLYEANELDEFQVGQDDTLGQQTYVTGLDDSGSVMNPANPVTQTVKQMADSTYFGYFNFQRDVYDYTTATPKTSAQKDATQAAIENSDFRLGFLYGLNVMQYLPWFNNDSPENWLMRGFTVSGLCSFSGKDYTDYVDETFNQQQGKTGLSLIGINNSSDPVYDPTKASQYFQAAHDQLIASGLTEADFPIQIDVIGTLDTNRQTYEMAMYDDLVSASNGILEIGYNIPSLTGDEEWTWPSRNFDFNLWGAWKAEYADPSAFLSALAIGGDLTALMGFDTTSDTPSALETQILGEYTDAYDTAAGFTDIMQIEARYSLFAQAEYKLIYEDAIIIPWLSQNDYVNIVSKLVPFTKDQSEYGLARYRYKNVIVTDSPITRSQRAEIETGS